MIRDDGEQVRPCFISRRTHRGTRVAFNTDRDPDEPRPTCRQMRRARIAAPARSARRYRVHQETVTRNAASPTHAAVTSQ
jgi:hypothetical protein